MTRSSRINVVVVALTLVATLVVAEEPARGTSPPSDRTLALRMAGGRPLDPVLSTLAEGQLVRSVAALRPGQVKVAAVPLGFALTGSQLAPLDVTDTLEATQAVESFVARLRNRGIQADAAGYTVYSLPPVQEAIDAAIARGGVSEEDLLGSSLIVPRGTAVEFVGAVFEDGQLYAKTTISAAPRQVQSRAGGGFATLAAPSDSEQFARAGGVECIERKQNSTAHYDPCQWFYKLVSEHDSRYDYWASEMYGTGKSHSVWTLSGLEVESRRKEGTAPQGWVDWDPGADAKTSCRSQTVSVSYAGASVGVQKQHCELWDIDKGRAAFDMSNWWRGHVWRSERETAAVTLTKTHQGDVPHGMFDFDFRAHP